MRRLHDQQGFTMLEVLIAASLIAIGLLALVGSFDTARSSVTRSKSVQGASHAGEQALEQIEARGYANIALTSAPASSTDPLNPGFNVGSGTYRWDGTNTEPTVIDSAGISPAPTAWGDSRFGGSIYSYVTWVCDSAVAASCPATNSLKRITVAVTLTADGRARKPIVFQTLVTDPTAGPGP